MNDQDLIHKQYKKVLTEANEEPRYNNSMKEALQKLSDEIYRIANESSDRNREVRAKKLVALLKRELENQYNKGFEEGYSEGDSAYEDRNSFDAWRARL